VTEVANASPRDTKAGFDLYRTAGGEISLDDLNARLRQAGYGPVAKRTFAHYRKLRDAGYNRYISINRFDIARASVPYDNASANGRYTYRDADLGVSVIFAKGSRLLEASGRAIEIGEVGALLRFSEHEVINGLRALKPQAGEMVTVRYLEAGSTIGGRVIEADLKSDPVTIEIEFSRLISIAGVGDGQALPAIDVSFRLTTGVGDEDPRTLDLVGRQLYQLFELLEGLRSLSNAAGARQPDPVYAEPPVLRSLSIASPVNLLLEVASQVRHLYPAGLAFGVLGVAGRFVSKRKEWYEGTGQKKQNQLTDLEIELKELELDAKRAEAEFRDATVRRMQEAFPESSLPLEEAARIVDEQVLPPLRALGLSGVTGLDDSTVVPPPNEPHPMAPENPSLGVEARRPPAGES
jgi:hypothetical protein